MGDIKKTPDLHPGNAVIAKLYSVVMDNQNLPELFSAWDDFVEKIFEQDPDEAKLWQNLLSEHFEQVSPLIFVTKPSLAEEKQNFVDRQTFPAILFNSRFRIVAKNTQLDAIWSVNLDYDVSSAALPPFKKRRILSMKENMEYADPVLISIDIGDRDESRIAMAVIHPVEFRTGDGTSSEPLFILRIAKPNWPFGLGKMLSATHGLTEAEIEITRAIYQNQSVNLIAKNRNRSVRTVRTQLSHIFEKLGTTSQSELIGMISNLAQILDLEDTQSAEDTVKPPIAFHRLDVEMRTCESPDGHILSYAVYGNIGGKPVLSLQPTIPPNMTKRFRYAAHEAGLYFITPFKPGSGQSSSRNYTYTPEHAAADYQRILEAENLNQTPIDVIGLCSGGIYALIFAEQHPNLVKTVTLVDTGAPLRSKRDFLKMSSVSRRTFLPARYFPTLLLSPHKMVAKEFNESDAGQKRIVHYFVASNPIDLNLVKSNREYYDVIKNIISYSFEDIKQLVDNVRFWAQNWEKSFNAVNKEKPIRFLHGEKNDMFLWSDVEAFAKEYENVAAASIPNQSQLGIFVQPDVLMKILKSN